MSHSGIADSRSVLLAQWHSDDLYQEVPRLELVHRPTTVLTVSLGWDQEGHQKQRMKRAQSVDQWALLLTPQALILLLHTCADASGQAVHGNISLRNTSSMHSFSARRRNEAEYRPE